MSRSEVLTKHSSRDLSRWQIYFSTEPFSWERTDLGFGIVASTVANANRAKSSRAFKPSDFMPKFRQQQEMPDEELESKLGRFVKAYGGKTGKLSEL